MAEQDRSLNWKLNAPLVLAVATAVGGTFALISFPTEAAAQNSRTTQGVNGRNVTYVNFNRGSFRQAGRGRWNEHRANGSVAFSFIETGRDAWSVYLNDRSRNIQIQIDLHRKWISIGQNGGRRNDSYRITSSYRPQANRRPTPRSNPPRSSATNGRNVTRAYFNGGSFRQTGNRAWSEYGRGGERRFNFVETGRDAWSVYLNDRSRNMQVQIDLYRKWISIGQNGGSRNDSYRISSSSRQPYVRSRPPTRPRPQPTGSTRSVNAGPIWDQRDANVKCPVVAYAVGGTWTGGWRTTVQGRMSVCTIRGGRR